MIFNTDWQGGIMKTILRTPFFLILFTIFSVSFSVSSEAQAQVRDNTMMKVREFVGERNGLFLGDKGYPIEFGIARTCIETQPPIGHEGAWNMARKNRTETWLVLCKWLKKNKVDNNLPLGPDIFGARQIKNSAISFPYTMNGTEIASSDWRNGRNPEKPDGPAPTPKPVVPPVIIGSYMQQVAEAQRLFTAAGAAWENEEEMRKLSKEANALRDVAILGELKRGAETNSLPVVEGTYRGHLSFWQDLNFRVAGGMESIPGFSSPFLAADSAKKWAIQIEKKKQAGGTPPTDGPPSNDPVKEAERKRDLAQQKVTTSQTELDAAKAKEQQAEQKLTTAKTKLEEAILALQEAEKAAKEREALIAKAIADAEEARRKAEEARIAFEKEQREEAERIAEAKRKAEEARLAALEKVRQEAEEAAKIAAEEAKKLAEAEAKKQAEELKLAENKATDAKSERQAAEKALKEAEEAAKSGDLAAKQALEEAKQKALVAELEFNKKAEAAQKEAKEKARIAAEEAASQAAEVAAAVAAMQKVEAAQKAAQDLARQAQEHAAKIREAWGLPTSSPDSGATTMGQPGLPVVGGSYMGQPGLPVVGGSYMGQPGLPVVGGSYQGPPQ